MLLEVALKQLPIPEIYIGPKILVQLRLKSEELHLRKSGYDLNMSIRAAIVL